MKTNMNDNNSKIDPSDHQSEKLMFEFSYFNGSLRQVTPTCVTRPEVIYLFIKCNSKLRQATAEVRRCLHDKELYRKEKASKLPFVTPGGVFEVRNQNGFRHPSMLFVVDIDHLESEERARQVRDELFNDTLLHPTLAFVSPSGLGVKLFLTYRIDPNRTLMECFTEAMQNAWMVIRLMHGLEPDTSNVDLTRACLLCHDPEVKFRQPSPFSLPGAEAVAVPG